MMTAPEQVPPQTPPTPAAPRINSDALLQGTREVFIEHRGELYRLRLTKNGKLILHK